MTVTKVTCNNAIYCPYAELGCNWHSFLHSDLLNHEQSCHYAALRDVFQKQQQELKKLQKENEELRYQLRKLRGDSRPKINISQKSSNQSSPRTPQSTRTKKVTKRK
jgi:hypothetical protein